VTEEDVNKFKSIRPIKSYPLAWEADILAKRAKKEANKKAKEDEGA